MIGGPDRGRTDDLFHAIQRNLNRMRDMHGAQGNHKARWEHFRILECALKCAPVYTTTSFNLHSSGWHLRRHAEGKTELKRGAEITSG
jgi:hypothetical protein